MSHHTSFRKLLAIVLAVAMVASLSGIIPATAAPGARGEVPKAPTKVTTTSTEVAATKLDSKLADKVKAGTKGKAGEAVVDIAVLAPKNSAKPADVINPLKMTLRGDPKNDLWVGKAKVSKLIKIASRKDVAFVYENGKREAPIVPDGSNTKVPNKIEQKASQAKMKARLEAAADAGALEKFKASLDEAGATDPTSSYDGGSATGWFDVSPRGHDSSGAWAQGYTGAGVKVAVADDSCDFGHPDLMGTNAVIDDPTSPYYGWPQAFDPFSCLLYAYDSYFGENYVANGDTWFSDTSATMSEADPTFDGHSITTPGTSLSGTYHMGYLWDENYYYFVMGRFPMVLLADENTAGVYDTVYVDLYPDYDFSYEKPCTKSDPTSYIDLWGPGGSGAPDGFADISGGMVYWISDGANQPPGVDFMFGGAPSVPGNGDLVCFMGSLNVAEDHGTLCSSNVVGQGLTDGPSIYGDYPPFKTPTGGGAGIVQGAAKDAGLVAIADIYWNHFSSTLAAYDYAAIGFDNAPGTGDDIQAVSNSYGDSAEDADGWDYRSRYITYLNTYYNPNTTFLFSTGNGAPGYGTNAPPSPTTAIAVGASTQMGACGGWDSIYDEDQVTVGDVIPWSNRGPTATGAGAPDIVADGAYSSGAIPLNQGNLDGWGSWDIWGGTSRSCPVATGNLALVYQAYKAKNGQWPTYDIAKQLFMNGARDLNYDTFVQGAGSIDASRAVSLAAGNGGLAVSPSSWNPGDFLGTQYQSFDNMLHPGDTYSDTLTVTNTGASDADVSVTDRWYHQDLATYLEVTLDPAQESAYDFNRPDYLTDVTDLIPPGTDIVMAKVIQDFEEFAPSGAFTTGSSTHNVSRVLFYDWKDQNANGSLWTDSNANGFVNAGEIDPGEYMRFTYHNSFANTHEIRVQTPLERMHDGVFLGVQHSARDATNGVTTLYIELSFWTRTDVPWLSETDSSFILGAGASQDVPISVTVPSDTGVGIYEAEYRVTEIGKNVTVVPVTINVASPTYGFRFGEEAGANVPGFMQNNQMFGGQDWNWRAESGDWRFFSSDGSEEAALPDGAAWLVHTSWTNNGAVPGHATDDDTLLYGPVADEFSAYDPSVFGPSGLGLTGGSANTNIGGGIWTFQTNTGTTEEWVAGPLADGLNQIMTHNVLYDGKQFTSALMGEAGIISVAPTALDIVNAADSGTENVDFTTYTLPLTGASAESYGLTRKAEETYDISTGADVYRDITVTDAAYLDVQTACPGQDIDMYVYWWNGTAWELVGASESSSGEEHVRIERPANGDYRIDVYGYSVSGTVPFDLMISSPMGHDMVLSGIPAGSIDAGGGFTLAVDWTKVRATLPERLGSFEGVIYLGPEQAPAAVEVPVTLRYPFDVESSSPASGAVVTERVSQVTATLTKQVDTATVSPETVYLTENGAAVAADPTYDDATATFTWDLPDGLANQSEYEIHFAGVMSADGDTLDAVVPFTTDFVTRAAGDDRYQTAIDASQRNFESAATVMIATGERFPDALTAGGLAGVYDAPLLLTHRDSLPSGVADEIDRLGAEVVMIVGGPNAVSEEVAEEIDALPGVSVQRVYGADRYATAAQVAYKMGAELGDGLPTMCFLARGDAFPDALSLSPFSYSQTIPTLLTRPTEMPQVTRDAISDLGFTEMLIAGQTSAVSTTAASGVSGLRVYRAGGADRYATAAEVAAYGVSENWGTWGFVGIATGMNFPDGLAGGVATGSHGGVLLLTPTDELSTYTSQALTDNAADINTVQIFGGPAAVSADVRTAIADLVP